MPQITATKVKAGVAAASLLDRTGVPVVRRISDIDDALSGEQMRIARMPRRHHAVEHVDAAAYGFDDILRASHAHQVTRLMRGHMRQELLEYLFALLFRLADRQSADGEPRESNLLERRQRFEPQFRVDTALNDPEQGTGRLVAVVLAKAPQRPAHGQLHGSARLFLRDRVRRALIE